MVLEQRKRSTWGTRLVIGLSRRAARSLLQQPPVRPAGPHAPSADSQSHPTGLHAPSAASQSDPTGLHTPSAASQSDPTGLHAPSAASQSDPTGLHTPSAASQSDPTGLHQQTVRPYRTASVDSQTLQDCTSRLSDPTGLHQQTVRPYRTASAVSQSDPTGPHAPLPDSQSYPKGLHAPSADSQTLQDCRLLQETDSHTLQNRTASAVSQSHPKGPHQQLSSYNLQDCTLLQETDSHTIQGRISSQPITLYRTASAVSQSHPTGLHTPSADSESHPTGLHALPADETVSYSLELNVPCTAWCHSRTRRTTRPDGKLYYSTEAACLEELPSTFRFTAATALHIDRQDSTPKINLTCAPGVQVYRQDPAFDINSSFTSTSPVVLSNIMLMGQC